MTAPKQPSPSDLELFKIYQRAYLERSKQGDPDHTGVIQCCHAACRALFEAGRESRRVDAAAYALLRSYAHQAYESGKTSLAEYEICLNELEKAYQ